MIWSAVLVHVNGRALEFQPLILGEPPLVDLADPGGVRRGEVEPDAGVGQQPVAYCRCLVRGEIVADHVDGQAGVGLLVDLVQELDRAALR